GPAHHAGRGAAASPPAQRGGAKGTQRDAERGGGEQHGRRETSRRRGGRGSHPAALPRTGSWACRQKDPALFDVPDAARRKTHDREKIGGQEEQRVERLVMRAAPPAPESAPPALAAPPLPPRARGHDAA